MGSTMHQGGATQVPVRSTEAELTGWGVFGGVALAVLGAVNVIQGITALEYDELLLNEYVYDNLTFWGWAFIVWGGLQLVAGVMTLVGSARGPAIGIVLSSVSAIGWFFMIFAAPTAAFVGMLVSFAIIAALSTSVARDM